MTSLIAVLFISVCAVFRSVAAAPFSLLNSEGKFFSSALKNLGDLCKQNDNFVQVIDCSSPIGECKLVNELFETQFTSGETGRAKVLCKTIFQFVNL